ncbi:uncharacterized protein LOC115302340 [Suricata suricatta]|uniref:uncharacterized protein LOC115302340 n=1 Tax=Suricata suricatta TaxID=37032 RepID=UPI0011559A4F|nr:uncharacterized protein LOC115302340 [Suricata suricatta]
MGKSSVTLAGSIADPLRPRREKAGRQKRAGTPEPWAPTGRPAGHPPVEGSYDLVVPLRAPCRTSGLGLEDEVGYKSRATVAVEGTSAGQNWWVTACGYKGYHSPGDLRDREESKPGERCPITSWWDIRTWAVCAGEDSGRFSADPTFPRGVEGLGFQSLQTQQGLSSTTPARGEGFGAKLQSSGGRGLSEDGIAGDAFEKVDHFPLLETFFWVGFQGGVHAGCFPGSLWEPLLNSSIPSSTEQHYHLPTVKNRLIQHRENSDGEFTFAADEREHFLPAPALITPCIPREIRSLSVFRVPSLIKGRGRGEGTGRIYTDEETGPEPWAPYVPTCPVHELQTQALLGGFSSGLSSSTGLGGCQPIKVAEWLPFRNQSPCQILCGTYPTRGVHPALPSRQYNAPDLAFFVTRGHVQG